MSEVNIAQVEQWASTTVDRSVRWRLMVWQSIRPTYEEFVRCVTDGLIWVCKIIERNPQLCEVLNEDQITIRVVDSMNALGFDAGFETTTGGHCDVTVKYVHDFVWLAEAKINTNNGWLWQGFQQLTTRYQPGQSGTLHGGMLIYCKRPRSDKLMRSWAERIKREIPDVKMVDRSELLLNSFQSESISERTGAPLTVLHLPVSLWFEPKA